MLEAVVTMLLVGIVFAIAASVITSYSRAVNQLGLKDAQLQSIMVGIDRMRSEVEGAFAVSSPPSSGSASSLTFQVIDPRNSSRFTGTTPWDPFDILAGPPSNDYAVTVSYSVVSGGLNRQLTYPEGTVLSALVADQVQGLACQYLPSGNLELVLSFQGASGIRQLRSEVYPRVRL
ncbi:MAG: type II secretion system protein [Candidatus Eremiobacteraeota bacterium]|nr:type II secretion system protein [Candidatus Eremiobacteraeota bacterium]